MNQIPSTSARPRGIVDGEGRGAGSEVAGGEDVCPDGCHLLDVYDGLFETGPVVVGA